MRVRRRAAPTSLGTLILLGAMLASDLTWGGSPPHSFQGRPAVGPMVVEYDSAPVAGVPVRVCPYCHHRGCICVPAATSFGYFPTLWRTWPGEPRPNKVFPQAVGAEPLATPLGEPAPRLPIVDFNKMTPPDEEPAPAAPSLPPTPPSPEEVLPPVTPPALPPSGSQGQPTPQPELLPKQSWQEPAPLEFPVESAPVKQVKYSADGLASVLMAPPVREPVAPMRVVPASLAVDRPAPDRLTRGVWDIRERTLTLPVGYAQTRSSDVPATSAPGESWTQ